MVKETQIFQLYFLLNATEVSVTGFVYVYLHVLILKIKSNKVVEVRQQ